MTYRDGALGPYVASGNHQHMPPRKPWATTKVPADFDALELQIKREQNLRAELAQRGHDRRQLYRMSEDELRALL